MNWQTQGKPHFIKNISTKRTHLLHRTIHNKSDKKLTQRQKIIRFMIVCSVVFLLGLPLAAAAESGFQQYAQLQSLAKRGEQDLQRISAIISTASEQKKNNSWLSRAEQLLQGPAAAEILSSSNDAYAVFSAIDYQIQNHTGALNLLWLTPFYNKALSLDVAVKIGVDVSRMISAFLANAQLFIPLLQKPLLSSTGTHIFTPALFDALNIIAPQIALSVSDLFLQLPKLQIADLPISASHREEIAQAMPMAEKLLPYFSTLLQNLPALRWIFGVDSPRTYLVMTMDRAELRPSGGFTGQFGLLRAAGGTFSNIQLTDVTKLDFPPTQMFPGYSAPAPYSEWWPWIDWGLRDANLSGSFPVSAQLELYAYEHEAHQTIDGVINISPLVIEQLLAPNILGPITIACYNYTATADNLEALLHYFQLGPGQALEAKCANNPDTTQRKQFTAALAQALQNKLKAAPLQIQAAAVESIISDIKNKEIQIYFHQSNAENILTQLGWDSSLAANPSHDTTAVIMANIGANKGSLYTTVTIHDSVSLTVTGSANHHMTITINYQPTGNVYGNLTLREYIRVYVPPNAAYINGSGFDETGAPIQCSGFCQPAEHPICQKTASNPYGFFLPDPIINSIGRLQGSAPGYFDTIGGPTNFASDLSGRAMFGGLTVIPPFCTAVLTLNWIAPHAAAITGSFARYTYTMERQSGTMNAVTVAIQPPQNFPEHVFSATIPDQTQNITWSYP